MGSIGQPASSPLAQAPSLGKDMPSQPQFQHQQMAPFGTPSQLPSFPALSAFPSFDQPSATAFCTSPAGIIPTPASKRKRSRDDDNESDQEEYFPKLAAPSIENDEWEFGEGMTLRRKGAPPQHIIDAGSQTGTWAEEQLKSRFPSPPRSAERPIIRNHKSQRVTRSSDSAGFRSAPNSSPTRQSPMRQQEPMIDNFTLHLGIGWSKISDDVDVQAAARGWAKYIENHFPVTSPKIVLKSRALESYLVEAKEGWFLFGEDLKQGKFVAANVERAFENLKSNPPTFDGVQTLDAVAQSPSTSIGTEIDSEAEEYGEEPHCYEASQRKRIAFLSSLGEGAGECIKGPICEGQVPELVEDDAMDMS